MLRKIISNKSSQNLKCVPNLIKTLSSGHHGTVDDQEMLRFKKLGPTWWDELGEMKALHSMNMLRVPLIRDGLINSGQVKKELVNTPKPLQNTTILDVGCGGGILTEALARLGSTITGLDASPELIEQAIQHAKLDPSLSNLSYSLGSVEDHVANNLEKYDAVVASEVVEHVGEKDLFLRACVNCLKPGGSIFITTLNKTFLSWVGGIIFAENILNLVPKGTHDWEKFISPHHMRRILEDNKCRTRVVHGMCYNFLTNTWYWISDTSINYALHAIKD